MEVLLDIPETTGMLFESVSGPYPSNDIPLIYGEKVNAHGNRYTLEIKVDDDSDIILTSVVATLRGGPYGPAPNTLDISEDGKIASSREAFSTSERDELYIEGSYERVGGGIGTAGTFNNLYLIDSENLRKLSGATIVNETWDDIIQKYIISVTRFPFPIDNEYLSDSNSIVLGNKRFEGAQSKKIDRDVIILDVGTIETPLKYNNSLDYINTECYLHLPYVPTIKLDINYVLGEEIGIQYIFNLYNGEGTINISSSKLDGDVFHSQTISLGTNIPYYNSVEQGYSHKNPNIPEINNFLKSAYVEVIRNVPYDLDSVFNNIVTIESKLNSEQGFVTVNEINLKNISTLREKEQIKNILRGGVYINENN